MINKLIITLIIALVGHAAAAQNYALEENGEYGYETDTGQVLFFRFLGVYDQQIQILHKPDMYTAVVYFIEPPYQFFKEVTFYDDQPIAKNTYRIAPGMVADFIFSDVKKNALDRYTYTIDGEPHHAQITNDLAINWLAVSRK